MGPIISKKRQNFIAEERECFLCKSTTGYQLFYDYWPVVGIGTISFGIRICKYCGAVFQDPAVPPSIMQEIYTNCSNYTNPGRGGSPTNGKIKAVQRHTRIIDEIVSSPGAALQIGCSDGYTLYMFKKHGWIVEGIEPSQSAAKIAQEKYNINPTVCFFEEYKTTHKYDLIILTHILEHIYNPVESLKQCHNLLKDNGIILIEVPLLHTNELWPPGYFTLEHVNYFSKNTLIRTLEDAGFNRVISENIYINEFIYPLITIAAKKELSCQPTEPNNYDFELSKKICYNYIKREEKLWDSINKKILLKTRTKDKIIIWGAGFHTSQLLRKTEINSIGKPILITDMDKQKWNLSIGGHKVMPPHQINYNDDNAIIIISSYASQEEIYNNLMSNEDIKLKILCLYNKTITQQ